MLFAGVRGVEVISSGAMGVHLAEAGNMYATSSIVNVAFAITDSVRCVGFSVGRNIKFVNHIFAVEV